MFVLVLLGGLIAAGLAYQAVGSYYDARRFPAPGRVFDVGRCQLHLNEQGTGSPAVVLESGIAASSLSWALVQPTVAEFTRVCSYDRAGLSWSGKCVGPRTLGQIVSDLETLLSRAGVSGPYVLVGHSFGGIVIRAFAHLHREEVAGLVFVDPVPLGEWANCGANNARRLKVAAKLSRRGALLARFGVVRAALSVLASGRKRLPQSIARLSAGNGREVITRLVGEVQKLPKELWPMVRSHWSCPKSFQAMAGYLESLPESARTAIGMEISPEIPFIILSAANASAGELEERESWVGQSEHGRHVRMKEGGHWIQLERPEIVVAAIQELVMQARDEKRAPAVGLDRQCSPIAPRGRKEGPILDLMG